MEKKSRIISNIEGNRHDTENTPLLPWKLLSEAHWYIYIEANNTLRASLSKDISLERDYTHINTVKSCINMVN